MFLVCFIGLNIKKKSSDRQEILSLKYQLQNHGEIMKLENVQIEIKNKEHYEAVKKRLIELGKWTFTKDFEDEVGDTTIRIYIHKTKERLTWDFTKYQRRPSYPIITLDDLYDAEKEKEIIEKFYIYSEGKRGGFSDTYDKAMEHIKKQGIGEFEIKKVYEVR